MSDDKDQVTLFDGDDAIDVDVATDPDESRTIVTGMTVSTEEKASTGDYESYTPYASRRIEFRPAIDASEPDGRVRVRQEAMKQLRDLQADIDTAIDARLSQPGFEDWPDSVPPTDPRNDGGDA